MKLVIREYLSQLKESKELDRLIPDLLLMMNITPISKPQIGVRQYGVDVAAVGKYEGEDCVLLFVIKQNDLGRSDWNGNDQSIRPSLDEIKDFYLETHIKPEHQDLKKIIIVCTGGIMKQEVIPNWVGYVKNNSVSGKKEYECWDGNKLAELISKYMLNENMLPAELQSYFRKVLALIADPDYNLSDYYDILKTKLLTSAKSSEKEHIKSLRIVHLLLRIVFYWANNDNNLKPAVYAAERTILYTWQCIRQNDFYQNKKVMEIFKQIYNSVILIYTSYFKKIKNHCYVKDGLHGYSQYYELENVSVFEQLGLLSTAGVLLMFDSLTIENQHSLEDAQVICDAIKNLIKNHQVSYSPLFDSHIIEISIALLLLSFFSEKEVIKNWMSNLFEHIAFAYYRMGRYFPVCTDNIDDVISLDSSDLKSKERLFEISTLLPVLMEWCAVLNLEEEYLFGKEIINTFFDKTYLQIWHPDECSDEVLYVKNAASDSGISDSQIIIPDTINEMKILMDTRKKKLEEICKDKDKKISSIDNGFLILPVLASRHYRMPVLPDYWQYFTARMEEEKIKANFDK
jgi:hypothetical protein